MYLVWEVFSEEKETQHGKNIVDAAEATGVKHLVWSTLDQTSDPVVKHCNSKAAVDDYLRTKNVPYTLCVARPSASLHWNELILLKVIYCLLLRKFH